MRLIALASCWVLLAGDGRALTAETNPEYVIKAAYLYNFALFVEWPADAFPARDAPIVIGIIGADPFEGALERTVLNKRINGRAVVVRRFASAQEARAAHILFVTAAEAGRIAELRERLDGRPVLVVGEVPEFARRGGTANFFIEENRVRFEVNLDAARRSRLNISARMLDVARIVRGN
jgi:hypothetical protein